MRRMGLEAVESLKTSPSLQRCYISNCAQPKVHNAIGQRGAASGASDAPTGCASNGDTEEE